MTNPLSSIPPNFRIIFILILSLSAALGAVLGIDRIIPNIPSTPDTGADPPPPEQQKVVRVIVLDYDTQEPLSDVDVYLRTSAGTPIEDKTDSLGYVSLPVLKQDELRIRLSKNGYKTTTTTVSIDSSQKKTPSLYLKKEDSITAPPSQNPPSQTPVTPDTPASTSSYNAPSVDGFWEVDINVVNDTSEGDRLRRPSINWLTFFQQEGDEFVGHIEDASRSVCKGKEETRISGSVQGKTVNWEVSYPGKCCRDAVMKFTGEFVASTSAIVGRLEPDRLSSSEEICTLLWAEVSMRRSGS